MRLDEPNSPQGGRLVWLIILTMATLLATQTPAAAATAPGGVRADDFGSMSTGGP